MRLITKKAAFWRRHPWFPREMTAEERARKFHTVTTQICVAFLIGRAWGNFILTKLL